MKDRKPHKEVAKKPQVQQPIDNSRKFMDDIAKSVEALKAGGIILYPTDTVWGIGCDATNENAVKKLRELIQPQSMQIHILVEHPDRMGRYLRSIPEVAIQLIEVNDKPMTIIYPGAVNLAPGVISPDGNVGIRISADEFCKKLIASFNKPVAFVPASISDEEEPEKFRDIDNSIIKGVDYTVKWRQNDPSPGITDSIIKVGLKGEIEIIRQ